MVAQTPSIRVRLPWSRLMAALVLSVAGAAVGGAVFGPVGAIAGRLAGAIGGNLIDRALFGGGARSIEGPRLADLHVMASTEGAPIPRVYGRARLSGQVIWATKLEEVASTQSDTDSGGKGAPQPANNTMIYSYFANFAVGLCEGPIGRVARIWADGKPLDLAGLNTRIYTGSETQTPDPLIVAREGARMRRPIAGSPMSCSSGCRSPTSATASRSSRSRSCARSGGSRKWCAPSR